MSEELKHETVDAQEPVAQNPKSEVEKAALTEKKLQQLKNARQKKQEKLDKLNELQKNYDEIKTRLDDIQPSVRVTREPEARPKRRREEEEEEPCTDWKTSAVKLVAGIGLAMGSYYINNIYGKSNVNASKRVKTQHPSSQPRPVFVDPNRTVVGSSGFSK